MADISKITLPNGVTYNLKDSGAPRGGDIYGIQEVLNGFAPNKETELIKTDRLDNAFYFADKRWQVSAFYNNGDGTTTVVGAANLFDMNSDTKVAVPANKSLVVTIDFTGDDGSGVFKNYPYGIVYLNFYYTNGPKSVSARVYGKHTGSSSFWRELTPHADPRNTNSQIRYYVAQVGMYNMQKLEITIEGNDASPTTNITEISYYLTRCDRNHDMPYLSKLREETLYYQLNAPNFNGKINSHIVNADVPSGAKFTDTTYSAVTDTKDGLMLSEDKVKLDKLVVSPLKSKTFTGVIGTANNFANASFYFGKIVPADYDSMWKISYRYHSYTNNDVRARGYYEVTLTGTANTLVAYSVFNVQKNTSYRPIYNHLIYRALEPGIVGGYGHLLGWRIYSSWQPTTAASARTFDIDILECENCEFTFFDAPIKYADAPGTGTTNYDAYTEINGTTNGRVRTGQDNNDANYQNRLYYSNGGLYAYAAGGRYTITFTKDDHYVLPITATDNKTGGQEKVYTTESFDPFGEIYYRNASEVIAANATIGNATLYRQVLVDARYSFTGVTNSASTSVMTGGKPVYIVCVPQSDGQVKLYSNPLSFTAPTTDDGLLYILLGYSVNTYQFELLMHHPAYVYKNGGLRELSNYSYYAGDAETVNGHTVNADVPSGAKFTDTTYAVATTTTNGLMSYTDKSKLDGISSSYDSTTETLTINL